MIKNLALLLLGAALFAPALAQDSGIPAHSIPISAGPGNIGWKVGGPCTSGQTLIWATGVGADPSCGSAGAASMIIGSSAVTGGTTNAILGVAAGPLLTQFATVNNGVFGTNGFGVPSWSTTLPSGLSIGTPTLTSPAFAGSPTGVTNYWALSTLVQIPTKAVLGNGTAGTANVSTPWTVANITDTVIPLAHGSVASGHLAIWNDSAGTLADGGVAGTAANQNTGTSGGTIPFLNGANVWSGAQTFSAVSNFNSINVHINSQSGTTYTVVQGTDYIVCMSSSSNRTVSLPVAHNDGDTYLIKDCAGNDSTNPITVKPTTSSEPIDGAAGTVGIVMNTSTAAGQWDRLAFTWSATQSKWITN